MLLPLWLASFVGAAAAAAAAAVALTIAADVWLAFRSAATAPVELCGTAECTMADVVVMPVAVAEAVGAIVDEVMSPAVAAVAVVTVELLHVICVLVNEVT